MRIRIRRGASVMQDFSFFRWPGPYEAEINTVFECEVTRGGSGKCQANGFGNKTPQYGNGAVYILGERSKP